MRHLMDKAGVLTFCIAYTEKYPEQCLAVLNFMIQGNGSRARKFITHHGVWFISTQPLTCCA